MTRTDKHIARVITRIGRQTRWVQNKQLSKDYTHFVAHVVIARPVEVLARPRREIVLVLLFGGAVVFERELGVALQESRLHALICN